MAINNLTAREVKAALPGRHADGGGLWLQVTPSSNGKPTRSWIFQYSSNGKVRQMGLGSCIDVSLAEAREKAALNRKLVKAKGDPLALKIKARQVAVRERDKGTRTFQQMVVEFLAAHSPGWRNAAHRQQWLSTLTTYAYPVIGLRAVSDISTDDILEILTPIWHQKPETASRLRGRIERVLSAARTRGFRSGENPARWKDHLANLLPKHADIKQVRNHPAMPFAEMPAFMSKLSKRKGVAPRALEVLILTAARTGEIIGMHDGELDLDNKLWTVPASRMKARKEHKVPLCDRVVRILRNLPREKGNPNLFCGWQSGTSLSNAAMLALMKKIEPRYVPHGFRSAFFDWAAEKTDVSHEIIEMALAHAISNKVTAAYRRGDMFDKRRALMNAWEAYLYPMKAAQ